MNVPELPTTKEELRQLLRDTWNQGETAGVVSESLSSFVVRNPYHTDGEHRAWVGDDEDA